MNTNIHPNEKEKYEEKEITYFVYENKEEFIKKRNKMFEEIRYKLVISDDILSLICYSGIYEYYKITKINEVIKRHLTILTNGEQEEWINYVCWSIIRTLESGFEALPINIFKSFKKSEFEKYLYDMIYYSFIGLNTEGFLSFIEEKNIYVNQLNDEVELFPTNMELENDDDDL